MSKLRRCLTCDTEFYTEKGKYCSRDCRPKIVKVCVACQSKFTSDRITGNTCSKKCGNAHARILRNEQLKDDETALTCLECNMKIGKSLTVHLNILHNMSVIEYQKKYNVGIEATTSISTRQILSEQNAGENNVWYNHQGKLSPFSKNNKRISEEQRLENQKTAIQNRIDNGNNTTSLEYYLKQTDGDETSARKLLRDRQSTFSLEKCLEKFGEEEGQKIWQQRQDKWQETLCSKSEEEQERINRLKIVGAYSKVSQQLFELIDVEGARYHLKNGEQGIRLLSKKIVYPDFLVGQNIIEFYGDRWHANPSQYNETDLLESFSKNKPSVLVKDIWERDKERISQLEELGYEVMIIWENDYKKEPERIIQQCKNFLAT